MMYSRRDIKRVSKSYDRAWLSSDACVAALDVAVRTRQNRLMFDPTGDKDHSPFGVRGLVDLVRYAVGELANGEPASLIISVSCALLAELLATAHPRGAGGIFKLASPDGEEGLRRGKQVPLLALRNALFHPGSIGVASDTSHVGTLLEAIEGDEPAARVLTESPRALRGIEVAEWSIRKIRDLGQFELGHQVLIRAGAKGVKLDERDRRRVLSVPTTERMEVLLKRTETVRQAQHLLAP